MQMSLQINKLVYQLKPLFCEMPKETSSSESDSEDDNLDRLREAADTDLINDQMFEQVGSKTTPENRSFEPDSKKLKTSQRNIESVNDHTEDLLVPVEIQKFVGKKLTKIIENRIEFVDIVQSVQNEYETKSESPEVEIKLTSDIVLKIDWNKNEEFARDHRKKTRIRKRRLPDVDDSKSESMRLSEASIDHRSIQEEVANWKTGTKGVLFEYRAKNGKFFEVEPKTEFLEKRKMNNWDESKISKNKNIFG